MKIKKFLGLMFGLVATLSVTSCGGGTTVNPTSGGGDVSTSGGGDDSAPSQDNTTTSSGEVKSYITEPTSITVWTNMGDQKQAQLDTLINGFLETEPNVTVEFDPESSGYDDLKQRVTTGFTANNYPNMVYCYPDHVATYFTYRKSVNMAPYADNAEYGWTAEDRADIYEAYLQEGYNYNGPEENGLYSMPWAKSSEALYYNTKILGLELDGVNGGRALNETYLSNLTWEEFFDNLCPALMEYDEEQKAAGNAGLLTAADATKNCILGYDSADNLFITLCQQYGIPYTSINENITNSGNLDWVNDEAKALMMKFYDYANKKYIATPEAVNESYTSSMFTAENCLFVVSSTAGTSYLASSNVLAGCTTIPQAEDSERDYAMSQGPSFTVLSKNGDNAENEYLACWLLYKYITSYDSNLYWSSNSGYFPIRKSVTNSERFQNAFDPDAIANKYTAQYLQAITYALTDDIAEIGFTSPVFDKSSNSREAVGNIATQVITAGRNGDTINIDEIFTAQYNIAIGG